MSNHSIDENYNGQTMLSKWWKQVKGNFANIFMWFTNHIDGIDDRHTADDIDYNETATVKDQLDSIGQYSMNIRSDYTQHVNGNADRHNATDIDYNSSTTVKKYLDNLNTNVAELDTNVAELQKYNKVYNIDISKKGKDNNVLWVDIPNVGSYNDLDGKMIAINTGTYCCQWDTPQTIWINVNGLGSRAIRRPLPSNSSADYDNKQYYTDKYVKGEISRYQTLLISFSGTTVTLLNPAPPPRATKDITADTTDDWSYATPKKIDEFVSSQFSAHDIGLSGNDLELKWHSYLIAYCAEGGKDGEDIRYLNDVGILSTLTTTAKTNIVSSINELNGNLSQSIEALNKINNAVNSNVLYGNTFTNVSCSSETVDSETALYAFTIPQITIMQNGTSSFILPDDGIEITFSAADRGKEYALYVVYEFKDTDSITSNIEYRDYSSAQLSTSRTERDGTNRIELYIGKIAVDIIAGEISPDGFLPDCTDNSVLTLVSWEDTGNFKSVEIQPLGRKTSSLIGNLCREIDALKAQIAEIEGGTGGGISGTMTEIPADDIENMING